MLDIKTRNLSQASVFCIKQNAQSGKQKPLRVASTQQNPTPRCLGVFEVRGDEKKTAILMKQFTKGSTPKCTVSIVISPNPVNRDQPD